MVLGLHYPTVPESVVQCTDGWLYLLFLAPTPSFRSNLLRTETVSETYRKGPVMSRCTGEFFGQAYDSLLTTVWNVLSQSLLEAGDCHAGSSLRSACIVW